MAASRWNDLPHPTPEYFLSKKVGQSLCGCPAFFYFCRVESKKEGYKIKEFE